MQSRYKTFLVLFDFAELLSLVPNTFSEIAGIPSILFIYAEYKFLLSLNPYLCDVTEQTKRFSILFL